MFEEWQEHFLKLTYHAITSDIYSSYQNGTIIDVPLNNGTIIDVQIYKMIIRVIFLNIRPLIFC